MDSPLRPLPSTLTIEALIDHEVERDGHAPLSLYVEEEWLPVLGPTSTLLYRRLGSWVSMATAPMAVNTEALAVDLGVSRGLGHTAPLPRSVGRLVMFGAAEWNDDVLAVRRSLSNVFRSRRVS